MATTKPKQSNNPSSSSDDTTIAKVGNLARAQIREVCRESLSDYDLGALWVCLSKSRVDWLRIIRAEITKAQKAAESRTGAKEQA